MRPASISDDSAIRDNSDRRLAEQERARLLQERATHAEADRVRDAFLSVLSHELRTPLNAILGWTALIRDSALDERAVQKAITRIERNARAQAQLFEDLLDMSQIVSGSLRLLLTATDFCQVVENAVDGVRPNADVKSVQLDVHFETRPLPMMGDPDRLQQAVWNLLSNAVKYSHRSSQVDVRVWTADDTIRLSVRDTGCGIDPTFLPHVFDPFRQADSSYARAGTGLGLGLAIVRSISELHGGRVEAASSGEDTGATLVMTLPGGAAAAGRGAEATHSDAGNAERLDGIRVLVVDDQADQRELLNAILSSRGAEVETADSGETALAIMQRGTPMVLVTDLAMPTLDGYELLRRVHALPEPHRSVPVIAVTAHARAEDRTHALSAGFRAYVSKPINLGRLVRAVKELAGLGSGSTVPRTAVIDAPLRLLTRSSAFARQCAPGTGTMPVGCVICQPCLPVAD